MVERQGKTVQEDGKEMTEVRDSDGGQRRQRGGRRAEGKGRKCRQISHNPDLQGLGAPRACCKSASSPTAPPPSRLWWGGLPTLSPRVTRMPESSGRVASELSFQLLPRGFLSSQPVFQESIS